ncbi:hypothetical protein K490DRAFT_35243, partial [Saccharata proteae CBS 121410]
DNENTIRFTNGVEFNASIKYINVYYRYVKQVVTASTITVSYISIDYIVADGLIKLLVIVKHRRFYEIL